jgi:D-alanyl-D-alanine carboxypeptidase
MPRRLLAPLVLTTVLVAGVAGCGGPAESSVPPFPQGLQQILDDGVRASNGLGISVAVIAEGHEPWTAVAGHSIRSNAGLVPMRPEMLFEIGSVDKNLITVIMLQLVQEGHISLDDPVSRWFPGYPQIPPTATVRDLIASTSGIAEWTSSIPRGTAWRYRRPQRGADGACSPRYR